MKNTLIHLTVFFAVILIGYLSWAFVLAQPNPFYWTQEQRGGMIGISLFCALFIQLPILMELDYKKITKS